MGSDKDVEKSYSTKEVVAKLRRLGGSRGTRSSLSSTALTTKTPRLLSGG